MTAQEIRQAYLDFYVERAHKLISRASLLPYNDPTTLFTGSGMQPLIPYLLGAPHDDGVRLVNSQTCLRAQDIDEVGDNRHTTFFEMLGNWSLGDYFKEDQIDWFFSFLTDVVGLDPNKLYVSCFIGSQKHNIPKDTDSAEIWKRLFLNKKIDAKIVEIGSQANGDKVGMQGGRIFFYDDSENWWSRGGGLDKTPVGEPCGPDSEVFYDFGEAYHDSRYGQPHPAGDSGRFMEIGNQVFMQYLRTETGFQPLKKKNVDFGGGLERIAAAGIDNPDVFKISLLWPIIEKLQELSGKQYQQHTGSMRVIADHLRAATFLALDGVTPSNKEQGYVMRRLVRRAIRQAFELGVEQNFMENIVEVIADLYHNDLPEVAAKRSDIIQVLIKEEKAFRQTLRKGLDAFKHEFYTFQGASFDQAQGRGRQPRSPLDLKLKQNAVLTGSIIFNLSDTFGFPAELSLEEAYKRGIDVDDNWREQFDAKLQQQRIRSQTAAKGTFKGGLAGDSLIHKKYHTATHLMYQALREVLGDHVMQRGSNITEERLRFDFSHPEKMTADQIKQVEAVVNQQIDKDLKISFQEYPTQVAIKEKGALGQFGDRYGDTVKVYTMIADGDDKPFSFEICGGPHVDHTAQLKESGKKFTITKESSISAGVRRIKAVLQ